MINEKTNNIVGLIGIVFFILCGFFLMIYPILGILTIIKNFNVLLWILYTFICCIFGFLFFIIHDLCEDKIQRDAEKEKSKNLDNELKG